MPIGFGTYNIRNGRNRGLESALRGMSQANMDLGIFQWKKCTDVINTRESAGYRVVATDAPSRHRGGVALFYRPSPLFAVEAVRQYGLNVMSFKLATGARRWYIIGCYFAPHYTWRKELHDALPIYVAPFSECLRCLFSPVGRREPPFQVLGSHPRRPPRPIPPQLLVASSILSSVGTKSSTYTGATVTGILSPGYGT